jgi:hypothetical protein
MRVYFKNELPICVSDERVKYEPKNFTDFDTIKDRWDWTSLQEVQGIAKRLTAITGRDYLGVDSGPDISPRYDIIELPKIGDAVSYGFNGDYYECGIITRITKKFMVSTSAGKKFNRRKESGQWIMIGGTWSMVKGTVNRTNMER